MTDPNGMDAAVQRIENDPALRAVLRTARAWGVSPRRFLGWEPKITTRTVAGISITQADIEWDDETRNLAMAFALWEADLCPGCSHPMRETTDADNEGRYVAQLPIRCHRCTASSQVADAYSEAPHPTALFLPIDFRPRTTEEILDADRNEDHGTA